MRSTASRYICPASQVSTTIITGVPPTRPLGLRGNVLLELGALSPELPHRGRRPRQGLWALLPGDGRVLASHYLLLCGAGPAVRLGLAR